MSNESEKPRERERACGELLTRQIFPLAADDILQRSRKIRNFSANCIVGSDGRTVVSFVGVLGLQFPGVQESDWCKAASVCMLKSFDLP